MELLAFAAVAVVGLTFLASRLIRQKLHMLNRYRHHSARFFALADNVLKKDHMPIEAAEAIRFVAAQIDQRSSARGLWRAMTVPNKAMPRAMRLEMRRRRNVMHQFERDYPEIAEVYDQALTEGFLAISYTSLIFGGVIRYVVGRTMKRHTEFGTAIVMDTQVATTPAPRDCPPVAA